MHVAASDADRSYDVVVRAGVLAELPALMAAAAPAERYAIICDRNVAAHYGERVLRAARDATLTADLLVFEAGEAHKTRETWADLTDRMLERGYGRDSCVVALGGGVAGDLAGFVAATYMRGLPLIQAPTTLLAMIDAAVGGKTGVDTVAGKNLVGAFHPPRLVVADPLVLHTLPSAEVRAGLAEAIKHGAILDATYFDWIERSSQELLRLEPVAIQRLVARSVELKAAIVAQDPRESGCRAVLNFGHTVAHALELHTSWGLPHGFAVGIGMVAEAVAGELLHVTESGTADRLSGLLTRCRLPVSTGGVTVDAALAAMRLDKKARRSAARFTLLARVGACATAADGSWTHEVAEAVARTALRKVILDTHAV
jgi:3-dehydroquinate synthase